MPLVERAAFGVGYDRFAPGAAPAVLDIRGRRVGAIICGDLFSRSLVGEAVAAGVQVLLVAARDNVLPGEIALRQGLALQALRSAEFGVPSVRAAYRGHAAFISGQGEMLATSALLSRAASVPRSLRDVCWPDLSRCTDRHVRWLRRAQGRWVGCAEVQPRWAGPSVVRHLHRVRFCAASMRAE